MLDALVFALALFAQPPATPPEGASTDVCLTNACATGPKAIVYARNEAAVAAAIRAKHAGDLIRAGGTAQEVAALLKALCGQPGQPSCEAFNRGGEIAFGRLPRDGSIVLDIRIARRNPDGSLGGLSVARLRNSDMDGIAAPDSVPRTPALPGMLANATTVEEPFTTSEGRRGSRVVGWRLTNGEVISPEEFSRRMQKGGNP